MPVRLAAILALLVFAGCLLIGALEAQNTFATTVWRALVAMFGTFVIGLIVGHMGQRMLQESAPVQSPKTGESATEPAKSDR